MMPTPALDTHVFLRVLEDRGTVQLDETGWVTSICAKSAWIDCCVVAQLLMCPRFSLNCNSDVSISLSKHNTLTH